MAINSSGDHRQFMPCNYVCVWHVYVCIYVYIHNSGVYKETELTPVHSNKRKYIT